VRILDLDDVSLKKVELWPAFMEMQQAVGHSRSSLLTGKVRRETVKVSFGKQF